MLHSFSDYICKYAYGETIDYVKEREQAVTKMLQTPTYTQKEISNDEEYILALIEHIKCI